MNFSISGVWMGNGYAVIDNVKARNSPSPQWRILCRACDSGDTEVE
jgi:hypothetical protein